MHHVLPINILIVDDNTDLAFILRESLALIGGNCSIAGDVHEALDVLLEFKPDCVLMDIGLPIMDGFETARTIRSLPHHANLPIIAHTAWDDQVTLDKCRAYQFDNHIIKPTDAAKIFEVVKRTLLKLQ